VCVNLISSRCLQAVAIIALSLRTGATLRR